MNEKFRNLKVVPRPGTIYENAMDNAGGMLVLTARNYPDLYQEAVHFYCIQAMWFLLHIPVSEMREDNGLYMRVMEYLRGLRRFILTDKYMPLKYKRDLLVFACLPAKKVKTLHKK